MINQRDDAQCRFLVWRAVAPAIALGCAFLSWIPDAGLRKSDYDITSSVRTGTVSMPIQKGGGAYRVGEPYVIAGRTYTPQVAPDYRAEGTASWYGDKFHGRLTANGEVFDTFAVSAAHPTLPLPSYVRVTNLENRRSMIVRVNDRGPFFDNRLIDVSEKTAKLLGFYDQGLAKVQVDYVGPAELEGSDDDALVATLREGDRPVTVIVEAELVQPRDEEPAVVTAPPALAPESVQLPESEIRESATAGPEPAQARKVEAPVTAAVETVPVQSREAEVPTVAVAEVAPVQRREPELPDHDLAEPVVVLIPQSVALMSEEEADGASASISVTVLIETPH